MTVVALRGIADENKAKRVCDQISDRINRAYARGLSHVLLAIPPPGELVMFAGKQIELKTTPDGLIIFQMKGTPRDGKILLPGEW